jgi:hypothetical protein
VAHIEQLDWQSLARHRDAKRRERLLPIAGPLHGSQGLFDVVP